MTKTTKERPIIFSAPMVRAILEGRKLIEVLKECGIDKGNLTNLTGNGKK